MILAVDVGNSNTTVGLFNGTGELLFRALLETVRERYDYCLLDAPAGLDGGFRLAVCGADRCVVVTTSDAASLRDAQHTVMELSSFPRGKLHLPPGRKTAPPW